MGDGIGDAPALRWSRSCPSGVIEGGKEVVERCLLGNEIAKQYGAHHDLRVESLCEVLARGFDDVLERAAALGGPNVESDAV